MTENLLELVGAGRVAMQQVRQNHIQNLCLLAYRCSHTSADGITPPGENWTLGLSFKLPAAHVLGQVNLMMLSARMAAWRLRSRPGETKIPRPSSNGFRISSYLLQPAGG